MTLEQAIKSIQDKESQVKQLKYKFSKVKKDGTMSWQSAGIYSYVNIEKVEQ